MKKGHSMEISAQYCGHILLFPPVSEILFFPGGVTLFDQSGQEFILLSEGGCDFLTLSMEGKGGKTFPLTWSLTTRMSKGGEKGVFHA